MGILHIKYSETVGEKEKEIRNLQNNTWLERKRNKKRAANTFQCKVNVIKVNILSQLEYPRLSDGYVLSRT